MPDLIAALKQFVSDEYEAQKRETYAIWKLDVPARVAEGEAIADVSVLGVRGDVAWLGFRENLSKFRVGDVLLLNRGNPFNGGFSCALETEREGELVVRAGWGVDFSRLTRGGGWVLDRDIVDIRHILLGALDTLGEDEDSAILRILMGKTQPRIDATREWAGWRLAQAANLNDSQSEAFARAYATENYYLIQGPPGTGKTLVLGHLAKALAAEGQRVLITAFTHRAINNALRKVAETGWRHVCKVGQAYYADDLSRDGVQVQNFERFDRTPYQCASGGYVIGATCFAARTSRLGDAQFDTVVFDEASQVTLPVAVAGMLSGGRYIFIGDHKQMAPVIVGNHEQEWVTRSIFETLFHHAPGTMLDVTYRMNAEINDFPSRVFYDGRLRPAPEVRDRRLQLEKTPRQYEQVLDPSYPSVFAEVRHSRNGMRSIEEAQVAAGLVAEALRCGVEPQEVALVAPYRAQGRLIRRLLRESLRSLYIDAESVVDEVVVDTVERIQGQERDLVILSLTTSDPAHAAQRAEFFFKPNRLNVAITRPRLKRIVIGSPLLFSAIPPAQEHQAWVRYFEALYHESHRVLVSV